MSRNRRTAARASRAARAVAASAALVALATACSQSSSSSGGHAAGGDDPAPATTAPDVPGRVSVQTDDVDLTITDAVAHLDSAGDGTLTMTVRNASGVPEHLDMVATPGTGRGLLAGSTGSGSSGSMVDGGILLPTGTKVAFGGTGPTVRFTHVQGVTAAHTLPLILEFGVARLVRLSARVTTS